MPDPISKAQEEEMSTALIAQLLAQDAYDQGAMDFYEYEQPEDRDGSYEDDSEDEFDPRKKPGLQPRKEPMKRGRKRKNSIIDVPKKEPKEPKIKEKEPIENKKLRKSPQDGYNTGVYTELEEKNFLEGLELFGRDWSKLQAHVATRDANSIRSHAQKHFIKMFRDNVPLSAKIRETGEGYTLSGKPLDPNSSAAKPYLKAMSTQAIEKLAVKQAHSQEPTQESVHHVPIEPSVSQTTTQAQDTPSAQSKTTQSLVSKTGTIQSKETLADSMAVDKHPSEPKEIKYTALQQTEITTEPSSSETQVTDINQAQDQEISRELKPNLKPIEPTQTGLVEKTSLPQTNKAEQLVLDNSNKTNQMDETNQKNIKEELALSVERQTEQLSIMENTAISSL